MKTTIERFKLVGGLAASLMLLPGCMTVGPDYEAPSTDLPNNWHTPYGLTPQEEKAALACWWLQFEDPALNHLIEMCANNNRNLATALASIDEARAILGIARGELVPSLGADGSLMRNRLSESTLPDAAIPPTRSRTDNAYSIGGAALWELDYLGRVRRGVESATAGLMAREEDYRHLQVILFAETSATYFHIRSMEERIRYAESNIDIQNQTLLLTIDRNAAGLVPDLDTAQASLNLNRTRSIVPQLREARERGLNALAVLTGTYRSEIDALFVPVPAQDFNPRLLAGAPVDVIRQRPDIRSAERQLAAQTARIGIAKAELYPRLSLAGSFAFESYDGSDVFDADSLGARLGPAFRWRLFEGSRLRSLIRAEEARTEKALAQYEQAVLFAAQEVEDSLSGVMNETQRRTHLANCVADAQHSVELASELYRSGLTDFRNVLENERALFVLQDELAASDGLLRQKVVGFYRAIGGGLPAQSIE